jgi:hypothetical protein
MPTGAVYAWGQEFPQGEIAHAFRLRVPIQDLEGEAHRPWLYRNLCHYLIDQIADQGLREAYDSLNGIRQFHLTEPGGHVMLPGSQRIPARLGEHRVRPIFQLDDNEE